MTNFRGVHVVERGRGLEWDMVRENENNVPKLRIELGAMPCLSAFQSSGASDPDFGTTPDCATCGLTAEQKSQGQLKAFTYNISSY
nr:uncharacterized protein CTRU02_00162 [Colletotrichum truncatum]KAF6801413.1 hypothetical protein CTRU02_00162 [Colletotrichum truncatum]